MMDGSDHCGVGPTAGCQFLGTVDPDTCKQLLQCNGPQNRSEIILTTCDGSFHHSSNFQNLFTWKNKIQITASIHHTGSEVRSKFNYQINRADFSCSFKRGLLLFVFYLIFLFFFNRNNEIYVWLDYVSKNMFFKKQKRYFLCFYPKRKTKKKMFFDKKIISNSPKVTLQNEYHFLQWHILEMYFTIS